jgi:hypothetical protein
VSGARIAVLVTSAGGTVQIDNGLITMARIFGISVRGVNSILTGRNNVISGVGFRTVDSRADARIPHLSGTDTANWQYAHNGTILTYLQFHPLAVLWLSIAVLVILCALWVRRRRAPLHPYPESTRWRGPDNVIEPDPVPLRPHASAAPRPTMSTLVSLMTRPPVSRARPVDYYRYEPRRPAADFGSDFGPPYVGQRHGTLRDGTESRDSTDRLPPIRDLS